MMAPFNGLVPLLQVYDMPTALAFYRDLLGFELVDRSPEIEAGHQDTCVFIACPELDAAYAALTAAGLAIAPPAITPYGMRQLDLRDRDGYAICLQWPAEDG
jgi:glyoxylase I family protein